MTTMELMENLAAFLRGAVSEYTAQTKEGTAPVEVYAGYPPIRTKPGQSPSFIYALVTSFQDEEGNKLSSAAVEIGFSIADDDPRDGWRSLTNIMEHVRQAMLKKRTIANKHRLELPIKGEIADNQPFPQWQGRITARYTIGQPVEEEINFD